jgi:hypothetical protein
VNKSRPYRAIVPSGSPRGHQWFTEDAFDGQEGQKQESNKIAIFEGIVVIKGIKRGLQEVVGKDRPYYSARGSQGVAKENPNPNHRKQVKIDELVRAPHDHLDAPKNRCDHRYERKRRSRAHRKP